VKPKKIIITKAIDAYVNQENLDLNVRFDIPSKGKSFIEHLTDAFYHFYLFFFVVIFVTNCFLFIFAYVFNTTTNKINYYNCLQTTPIMKTVSIVENYIKTKPFFIDALSLGIINLTSLSRNIMSDLESEFGKSEARCCGNGIKD
jgi:hypothetical protein